MPSRAALLLGLLPIFLAAACSSPPAGGGAPVHELDTTTGAAEPQPSGQCSLRASGVSFPTSACEACMQGKCCELTVQCFSHNAECTDLHRCLGACPSEESSVPVSMSAGSIEDDDAGPAACAGACRKAHHDVVIAQRMYNACIRTSCAAECGG